MSKRVFLVSSDRLVAYGWRRGEFSEPIVFMADEEGLTRFAVYLERDPNTRTLLLVNFVEEAFREETIPHVLGGDRRALVRAKLNRAFRDATYAHAIFQGRESEGRRDDRLLFTALIRPDLLTLWMGQIGKHKVPLAGVYSLPIISQRLLKPLGVESAHALLVTEHSAGGLRQTFFLERQLKLSRLAVIPRVERRSHASHVLGEVEQFRRYLNSLRMLPHDSPLDVFIVVDAALLEDVQRQSPDSPTTRHHLLPLEEVARRIGVRNGYESPFADRLFVQALARRKQPNQYAPQTQTRYHTLAATRDAMKVAAAVLLGVSVVWSALKFAEGVVAARDSSSVERQAALYEKQHQRARERLPATPVDSRGLQQAVELARILGEYKTSPMPMMGVISDALEDFPRLHVDELTWRSSTDSQAAASGRGRGASTTIASPFGGGDYEQSSGTVYQLARVKGRIASFAGDYREALDLVSRFAERLRELRDVHEVRIVSLPLDIGSGQRLSGDASVEATIDSAPFELRVVLKERNREA